MGPRFERAIIVSKPGVAPCTQSAVCPTRAGFVDSNLSNTRRIFILSIRPIPIEPVKNQTFEPRFDRASYVSIMFGYAQSL